MCGNLGLLLTADASGNVIVRIVPAEAAGGDDDDARAGGSAAPATLKKPDEILSDMVAATEVRGGQAGGISAFEFHGAGLSHPVVGRVRAVARKRYPLSEDLRRLYRRQCPTGAADDVRALSVVGHTRFATGSVNKMPELHPHDWYQSGYRGENTSRDEGSGMVLPAVFRWDAHAGALVPIDDKTKVSETVYMWDAEAGELAAMIKPCIIHLTHNGDFDALEMYGGLALNAELGLWLERVLQQPNSTTGDSPKLAGMMELLRVQGRWGPAARLAWLRTACTSLTDVTAGEPLSKTAPFDAMPSDALWHQRWAPLFEAAWQAFSHKIVQPLQSDPRRYTLSLSAVRAMREAVMRHIDNPFKRDKIMPGAGRWPRPQLQAFVHHTIRGFLRFDLYTALNEVLGRAVGSFGIQVHCSLEPGVVVLGAKGQPMQVAFSHELPLVLFGSEAAAVRAAVTSSGQPLPWLLALDELGEVVRVGPPAALMDGTFTNFKDRREYLRKLEAAKESDRHLGRMTTVAHFGGAAGDERGKLGAAGAAGAGAQHGTQHGLVLGAGVHLRAYSINACVERTADALRARTVPQEAPLPHPPAGVDLVASDLAETPGVLRAIDDEWDTTSREDLRSPTVVAADSLAQLLVRLMQARRAKSTSAIDLLIGAIEVSLWLAEQFASDLLATFPYLRVRCVSANQLLGIGAFSPRKTFFAGEQPVDMEDLQHSAVLLVSHSGQTFPTLHATRLLDSLCPGRVWLMSGTPNSQMEQALRNAYAMRGLPPPVDRTMLTQAGNRPAEPTSLAAAAMQHTFTHVLLHLVTRTRQSVAPRLNAQTWEGRRRGGGASAGGRAKRPPAEPLVRLSEGCLADMRMLVGLVVPDVEQIVGASSRAEIASSGGKEARVASETHAALVRQGRAWAEHIREPWLVLCLVGAYVFASVTLGAPLVWLTMQLVLRAAGARAAVPLAWSLAEPEGAAGLHGGIVALGFVVRALDALIYVYCAKLLTWALRLARGRPLWARHGKRTLVIVDTPTNHQMLEMFCSKLFALSYSFNGIEVHGANGVDHFVHTFTHRVARGLLLAVGRPDGRLCCLAKTEQALLLACKQAIFIQNPSYSMAPDSGNAPEVFSVGHNPMSPGYLHTHVPLPSTARRRFVDELVYERTILTRAAQAPKAVLRTVREKAAAPELRHSTRALARGQSLMDVHRTGVFDTWQSLPYGAHYATANDSLDDHPGDALVRRRMKMAFSGGSSSRQPPATSDDPGMRLSFADKLDATTNEIQDRQIHLQRFYESRVASLERYLAFCVTFHEMARVSSKPWFRRRWQVERSQSNLRVATTAAPISASDAQVEEAGVPMEVLANVRKVGTRMRGFVSHF